MKKIVSILLLFAFLTLLLPLATLALKHFDLSFSSKNSVVSGSSPQLSGFTDVPASSSPITVDTEPPLSVLNAATGAVETIPMRQFLIGSVASELPVSYQKEAFKAQTIAIHSYVLASKALQQQTPDAALHGAALRINPSLHEGYMSEEALKTVWGDQFASNYAYVCAAVDEVLHEVLLYGSAPALTTYYAISNGSTEASEAVWSTALPYLVRLDAPLDKTAPDYEVTKDFSVQEVADALGMHFTAMDLQGTPDTWFGTPERSPAGYILRLPCGGQVLKGIDVRAALGLRSADFTISYNKDTKRFSIVTHGYGHGVGLSQYTANAFAITGKTYAEILAYFYPGTVLSTI